MGAVCERSDRRIEVETPPDPRTGARVRVFDRLDFVHAVYFFCTGILGYGEMYEELHRPLCEFVQEDRKTSLTLRADLLARP